MITEAIGIGLGVWLAAASALQFYLFRKGRYIHEPNKAIATLEFVIALSVFGFFIWRGIDFIRRRIRK